MYKKTQKPEQVTGIIDSIVKGEKKKAEYLGNSDYYVMTLKIKGNDKEYEYNVPENDSFDFKVGDEVFFRSSNYSNKNKIAHRSLGKKVQAESNFELSSDLLDKLKARDDLISKKPTNKIKPH